MTETTDIKALAADMRDLADRIIECQGENSDGEDIIRLYDHSDTVFKAENILLVLDGLEAERQRADDLQSEQNQHDTQIAEMEGKIQLITRGFRLKTERCEKAEKELAALRSNHAIECQNAVRIALQASPRGEQEPVGSFHICDGQVEATTDYVKDGEWPIQNGELLVYANPPKPVVVLPEKSINDYNRYWIDYQDTVKAIEAADGWVCTSDERLMQDMSSIVVKDGE